LVTGAAGQIGYSIVYQIAQGNVFGPTQPVTLVLFDVPFVADALDGVRMELEDCAAPLLHSECATMVRFTSSAPEVIATTDIEGWAKDAKTELQEWLQARRLPVPGYRIVHTRGQAHAQTFEVECTVPALGLTENGEGRSRRVAEQEAAHRMLQALKASDKPGSALRS